MRSTGKRQRGAKSSKKSRKRGRRGRQSVEDCEGGYGNEQGCMTQLMIAKWALLGVHTYDAMHELEQGFVI